jgi:hypothetical protein
MICSSLFGDNKTCAAALPEPAAAACEPRQRADDNALLKEWKRK